MTKLLKYQKYMESVSTPLIIKAEKLYDMIPESIKKIHSLFMKADRELYLVGGSVRDFKTGDEPKDFDIATNAMPDEVMRILKGYRKQLQGEAFGVVVVYTDDQPDGIEIATFREDRYGNSDMEDFILYIRQTKPKDYEKRINILLNMSDK